MLWGSDQTNEHGYTESEKMLKNDKKWPSILKSYNLISFIFHWKAFISILMRVVMSILWTNYSFESELVYESVKLVHSTSVNDSLMNWSEFGSGIQLPKSIQLQWLTAHWSRTTSYSVCFIANMIWLVVSEPTACSLSLWTEKIAFDKNLPECRTQCQNVHFWSMCLWTRLL